MVDDPRIVDTERTAPAISPHVQPGTISEIAHLERPRAGRRFTGPGSRTGHGQSGVPNLESVETHEIELVARIEGQRNRQLVIVGLQIARR